MRIRLITNTVKEMILIFTMFTHVFFHMFILILLTEITMLFPHFVAQVRGKMLSLTVFFF